MKDYRTEVQGNREFKMLRRQRDHYGQNKIILTNGNKENLLFIVNGIILIQKKKLMTTLMSRMSFTEPNLK